MDKRRLAVSAIRALFRIEELFPQQNRVAFLSRQSSQPFDFSLLEPVLREQLPGCDIQWSCVREGGKLGLGVFLRQLWLVASSRVCLVDGYVPAVSIPLKKRASCVQLWHAVGAIKAFGYQCLDTPAGRSRADAEAFRMHCGYDRIVAGLSGAIPSFSAAFKVEEALIKPLGLPRMDYLLAEEFVERRAGDARAIALRLGLDKNQSKKVILYAPTFRKGTSNPDWLSCCVRELAAAFRDSEVLLLVAGHPLETQHALAGLSEGDRAWVFALGAPTIQALSLADLVVSDYSAVAFEAALAGKPVAFYAPDIDDYRKSPGLNVDPFDAFPEDAFTDAAVLAQAFCGGECLGARFAGFMLEYAQGVQPGSTERVAKLIAAMM